MRTLWNVAKGVIFVSGILVWVGVAVDLGKKEEPEPIVRPIMLMK